MQNFFTNLLLVTCLANIPRLAQSMGYDGSTMCGNDSFQFNFNYVDWEYLNDGIFESYEINFEQGDIPQIMVRLSVRSVELKLDGTNCVAEGANKGNVYPAIFYPRSKPYVEPSQEIIDDDFSIEDYSGYGEETFQDIDTYFKNIFTQYKLNDFYVVAVVRLEQDEHMLDLSVLVVSQADVEMLNSDLGLLRENDEGKCPHGLGFKEVTNFNVRRGLLLV